MLRAGRAQLRRRERVRRLPVEVVLRHRQQQLFAAVRIASRRSSRPSRGSAHAASGCRHHVARELLRVESVYSLVFGRNLDVGLSSTAVLNSYFGGVHRESRSPRASRRDVGLARGRVVHLESEAAVLRHQHAGLLRIHRSARCPAHMRRVDRWTRCIMRSLSAASDHRRRPARDARRVRSPGKMSLARIHTSRPVVFVITWR